MQIKTVRNTKTDAGLTHKLTDTDSLEKSFWMNFFQEYDGINPKRTKNILKN